MAASHWEWGCQSWYQRYMACHLQSGSHETSETGMASVEVTVPLASSLTWFSWDGAASVEVPLASSLTWFSWDGVASVEVPLTSSGRFHLSFHTASVSLSLKAIRPELSTWVNRAKVTSHVWQHLINTHNLFRDWDKNCYISEKHFIQLIFFHVAHIISLSLSDVLAFFWNPLIQALLENQTKGDTQRRKHISQPANRWSLEWRGYLS